MNIEKLTPNSVYYRIKNGDNKSKVAEMFNTEIQNVKCLTENCEEEGDFYFVTNIKSKTHVVKPLETLSSIAKKYNVSEEKIIGSNNLKTKALFIGQKLRF